MNDSSYLLGPWPASVGLVVALGGAPALGATSRHVFGDSPSIGGQTMLQLILALFYLWRRDLLANMLAHSTWLIVALFTTVPTAI